MALPERDKNNDEEGPVIRDTRRIDPETGELRVPDGEAAPASPTPEAQEGPTTADADDDILAAGAGADTDIVHQLAERTADLQRMQAEYANYRKRVERDRESMRTQLLAQVVGELLPVLDDIGRAREHEELTGGFKSVGEGLEAVATKMGLTKYAQPGEEFDPNIHEALTMVPSPDATTQTIVEVFQPGYRVEERIIRPARVVVTGPIDDEPVGEPVGEPAGEDGTVPPGDVADESDESATGSDADSDTHNGHRERE